MPRRGCGGTPLPALRQARSLSTSGGVSAEEAEGRAKLLLHKKLTPAEGPYYAGRPMNITLQVWNQGPGNAYSVVVTDENWKQDKFRTVFQGNNFTLDFLNAGEQYVHEFTVVPVKTILAHRVKPAKMVFVDGVEGESTITHHSNSWPEIRVMDPEDSITDYLLMVGRCGPPASARPPPLHPPMHLSADCPPPPLSPRFARTVAPPAHRVPPATVAGW